MAEKVPHKDGDAFVDDENINEDDEYLDEYVDYDDDDNEEDLGHVRTLELNTEEPPWPHKRPRVPLAERNEDKNSLIRIEKCCVVSSVAKPRPEQLARLTPVATYVNPAAVAKLPQGSSDIGDIKLLKADLPRNRTFPSDNHLVYRKLLSEGPPHQSLAGAKRRMSYGSLRISKLNQYDPSQPSQFDKLSDEIVMKVLEILPRQSLVAAARTCKRMKSICYDEMLWARVDFAGKWLKPGVVGRVVLRGTRILRMARTHVAPPIFDGAVVGQDTTSPSQSLLSEIELPKLQYLDLSMASITADSLVELIGACRNLVKVGLEQCNLNDGVLLAVSKNTLLQTLHLGMATGVTTQGLQHLANLRNLEELNLGWINLTDDMLEPLRNGVLAFNALTLNKLNLAGAKNSLDDYTVEYIARNLVNLDELDVSDANRLTGNSLAAIVDNANNLQILSLSRCYAISPREFLSLYNCQKLQEFSVYGMLKEPGIKELRDRLHPIQVNINLMSHIARPTTGRRKTSIWNMRTRNK